MLVFRLTILFLLGLLGRRIYLALKSLGQTRPPRSTASPGGPAAPSSQPMGDLTEQDISDADFEEIP